MKKSYIRNLIVSVLVILIVPVVTVIGAVLLLDVFISTDVQWQVPRSGIWYCEELKMQLHFRRETIDSAEMQALPDTLSYVIREDGYVKCMVSRTNDPYVLKVTDSKKQIFKGKTVDISEDKCVFRDKSGKNYVFTRIEEFSLDKLTDTYGDQISQYNDCENIGKVPHITLVIQKACDLWKSELGVDITESSEVVVAVDRKTKCWFVSTVRDSSPMMLVDTEGNVMGLWMEE